MSFHTIWSYRPICFALYIKSVRNQVKDWEVKSSLTQLVYISCIFADIQIVYMIFPQK